MAYSLSDYFRPLRIIFRLNGIILGIMLGLCLLITPKLLLNQFGAVEEHAIWPLRYAGAYALAIGILLINQAGERTIPPAVSLVSIVSNALSALVLLVAYIQQEVSPPDLLGQLILTGIFVLNLLGAVVPIRYMRADYRRM